MSPQMTLRYKSNLCVLCGFLFVSFVVKMKTLLLSDGTKIKRSAAR
jgi:hypothetical protein